MTAPVQDIATSSNWSRSVLFVSIALPMVDIVGLLFVRLITSPENRTAVLGLFTFFFTIGCVFALFSLLLADRRPISHVIAYITITSVLTLFNFVFFDFARRWEQTFESM
jgi:hypothetical protein